MDDSQDLLRWMSRHRAASRRSPLQRPRVRLACWKCGHERTDPRPEGALPCSCGGVYTEVSRPADDPIEED